MPATTEADRTSRAAELAAAARGDLDRARRLLAADGDPAGRLVAAAWLARASETAERALFTMLEKEAPMQETRVYDVPDISCGHCERAITEEVSTVAGVASVSVDLKARRVSVLGGALDDRLLREAIERAGYEAR